MGVSSGGAIVTIAMFLAFGSARADELRHISRNSLIFLDSVREGGEWAAYRVVDERTPVIFAVTGPGRVLLKLRTFVQSGTSAPKEGKDAIGAILKDQEIILTARVEAVKDAEERFVEVKQRAPSKAKLYVVRLGPGEHTVTVRFSEGASLLVSARFSKDEARLAPGGDLPLVAPRGDEAREVEHIGKIRLGENGVASPEEEASAEELVGPPRPRADVEEVPDDRGFLPARAPEPSPFDESWAPRAKPKAEDETRVHSGPSEGSAPEARWRAGEHARVIHRMLTVPAPYFLYELRGGVMFSRLGLDAAPLVGMDARIPLPGVDSRRFTIGLSADLAFARGQAEVLDPSGRATVDVAKIRHTTLEVSADVRWVWRSFEGVFDPYVAAGLGGLFGWLATENQDSTWSGGTTGFVFVARAGGAFGAMGHRPFMELRGSLGHLSSSLTRSDRSASDSGTAYGALSFVIGYRFELLGDAATD